MQFTEEIIYALEKQILNEVKINPKGWKQKFKSHPEYEEFLNWKFPKIINEPLITKVVWLKFSLTDYPICPTCHKYYRNWDEDWNSSWLSKALFL